MVSATAVAVRSSHVWGRLADRRDALAAEYLCENAEGDRCHHRRRRRVRDPHRQSGSGYHDSADEATGRTAHPRHRVQRDSRSMSYFWKAFASMNPAMNRKMRWSAKPTSAVSKSG